MTNYKKQFISYETFLVYQQVGIRYEGFIEGMGYTYYSDFAIAPQHMQMFSTSPYVPYGYDHYILGTALFIDSSPEAVARSYNMTADKIKDKIVSYNNDGSISVNFGLGNYMTLPKGNKLPDVQINDNGSEQTVQISATNTTTGDSYSVQHKLVDLPLAYEGAGPLKYGEVVDASEGDDSILYFEVEGKQLNTVGITIFGIGVSVEFAKEAQRTTYSSKDGIKLHYYNAYGLTVGFVGYQYYKNLDNNEVKNSIIYGMMEVENGKFNNINWFNLSLPGISISLKSDWAELSKMWMDYSESYYGYTGEYPILRGH